MQAFLWKNMRFLSKKTKKREKRRFFLLIGDFPQAIELGSTQKIGNGHSLFAGLLHLGQEELSVPKDDFQEGLVVSEDSAHAQVAGVGLKLACENFQFEGLALEGNELSVGGGVGRQTSDVVEDGVAALCPIHMAKLLRDFWGGFQHQVVGEFFLGLGDDVSVFNPLDGLHHDLVSQQHQLVV